MRPGTADPRSEAWGKCVGCIVLEGGETAQEIIDVAEEYDAVTADGEICVRPPGMGMIAELLTEEDIRRHLDA